MADSKQQPGSKKNSSGFLGVGGKVFFGLLICFAAAKFFLNEDPEPGTSTRPAASGEQKPSKAIQDRPTRTDYVMTTSLDWLEVL